MPSTAALPYLHLAIPFLLLIPLLSLVTPPRTPEPGPPGIIPITIRRVTPRRGLILTTLVLLAFTSFLDGVVLIANFFAAGSHPANREDFENPLVLASWLTYSVGGLVIWSLAAIVAEWRAKWGDRAIISLQAIAFVCEVPNLVLLVLRLIAAEDSWKLFAILSIPPSALRLLLLPVLLVAVASPKISYVPADEQTGLLDNEESDDEGDQAESSSSATVRGRQSKTYGTFPNGTADPSRPSSADPPQTGANTPAVNKGPIKIPKKLGEIKKEDTTMQWREVLQRVRKLSPYLWPSTSRRLQAHVVLCVFLLLVGRALQPFLPIMQGRIVRALTLNQGGQTSSVSPWPPFIAYFAIRITVSGSGLLYFLQQRLWIPISQYTDREMMMMCFNHLLNLSLAYHTKRNTGEVLKVIDRGSAINNLFQTVLFTALPTVFDIIIGFGVFLALYGPALALFVLAVMVTYLCVSVWATQRRVVTRRQLMERDVKQRGIISDVLTNWESVKYFTAETRESVRFREAIVSYQEMEAKWNIDYQLLYLVQTFLLALGLLSGSLIIAHRILQGSADAAEFVVFVAYFQQLSSPLDRLGFLYQQLNRNSIDAEKMFTLLAQTTEVNDKPGAKDLVITDGVVEFDDVSFSYDGKVTALKNVSFKIDKGQSMALVGESGSGKSTILRLLYRFYDIDSGTIRIDGQDIAQVTQLSLRKAIGIVPQDSVLWNDTIGANISYGKEGAADEEIIAAARAARLHDRILSFNEDYSTIVGERGVRLSGGEKQRVSLARMFLKSPAILVLDEATSALDTETEREIQKALADLAKGRSSLSIAHRLSTIINSDQIVVMKDGQVIENGGYAELLELDGSFATMWKKQIHTEAEMVAQAQADVQVDSAPLITLDIADPSKKDDGGNAGSDDQQEKQADAGSSEPDKSKSTEERVKEENVKGFFVEGLSGDDVTGTSSGGAATPKDTGHSAAPSTGPPVQTSYAEAVKQPADEAADVSAPPVETSVARPDPTPAATVPPPILQSPSTGTSTPFPDSQPSGKSGTSTPDKRISFPPLPRLKSSQSAQSGLSEAAASPSGSPSVSTTDLRDASASPDDSKGDKRRKRLSSIKGFVRRISDQGGLSRSNSQNSGLVAPKKSPMGIETDERTALLGAQEGQGASAGQTTQSSGGASGSKKKKKGKGKK